MKTKTNAEMLKSIRQYNKTEREKKALKEGFATSALFIAFLENQISLGFGNDIYSKPNIALKTPSTQKKSPIKTKIIGRPVIHIVDIIDKSGSMAGGKDDAAVKGINMGVAALKEDTAEVDYTYTLCDFSDTIIFRNSMVNLDVVKPLGRGTRNSTSLYDAIGETVQLVTIGKKHEDKVLVNIYTDGQENSSKKFRAHDISNLIEQLSEQGWTFTFIGTAGDVAYAQRNLKFHESNTLVHDNTEMGFMGAMHTNSVSRSNYSSKAAAGEDVSKGFYKDIK
jgi:hypothetical protein